jgi:alpha-D-ribose 1-methylphosphonate 5-triphosphate synthase subunit PhnL
MPAPDIHLAVDGLVKSFTLHLLGGRVVAGLRGVSLALPRGAFVGVIGPSGSGKSSLLKCIYRTYLANEGSARYVAADGREIDLIAAPDEEIIRLRGSEIGYVSQFLRPTPRVTAVDLVARPLAGRGVEREEARARATELLRRLALPADLLDGYPVLFSGGEQQRVNIARALIALPRLLLLDEPTSALDAANQATVIELLREAHAAGTTILGIFHDLDVLRQLADSYILMRDGRLVGHGPIDGISAATMLAASAR